MNARRPSQAQTIATPLPPADEAGARAVYAGHLLELVGTLGIEHSKLLSGTGLTQHDFAQTPGQPAPRISFAQQLQVYHNAVRHYPGDDLGIQLGQRIKISDHGVVGFAVQSSRNLAEALRIALRFFTVAGPLFNLKLESTSTETVVVLTEIVPLEEVLPVALDEVLTIFANHFLAQTDPRTAATVVYVPYAPGGNATLAQMLGCPLKQRKGRIEIRLRTCDLQRPFRLSDEETALICEARCEELIKQTTASNDITDTVGRLLLSDIRRFRLAREVADELHISQRSLRRQLAAAGTNFRDIRDNITLSLAHSYLQETDMSIDEIAFLLGYADTPNFSRAYRRWTGMPPGAARD